MDRLAGDADLVATLRATEFSGPDYDWVRDEFVRYGLAVLAGWLKRGAIRGKCLEKRLRGVPTTMEREFDYDTAYELAGESVARADEHLTGRVRGVEDDVIEAQAAAAALAGVRRPDARKALVMQSLGYPVPQIAAALGMTVKAVERMLEYAKKNARETA